MLYSTAVSYYKTSSPERSSLLWRSSDRAPVPLWVGMSGTVGAVMIPITRTTYADGVVQLRNSYFYVFNVCDDLQLSQLRDEYRAANNKIFSASTLCTDQLAALKFHASAVRVLGAAGGGL